MIRAPAARAAFICVIAPNTSRGVALWIASATGPPVPAAPKLLSARPSATSVTFAPCHGQEVPPLQGTLLAPAPTVVEPAGRSAVGVGLKPLSRMPIAIRPAVVVGIRPARASRFHASPTAMSCVLPLLKSSHL
jgi:hypothetical protein